MQDDSHLRLYIVSYYWALQTLTTVGFGDITSYNAIEHVFASIWMICGVGFYSYIIGAMT